MSQNKLKAILILSTYSSGSSALQALLTSLPAVHHIVVTRHEQNETLYWVKAASILGLPQLNILDSEVPIGSKRAKADLVRLLKDNIDNPVVPSSNESLIFDGWLQLCEQFAPVFVEKSPHHLHQWSAIELILESINRHSGKIDFLLIGLVRNPMDTIYSIWKRWKTIPEKNQFQWLEAYRNLIRLKSSLPEKVCIVKYEDIVSNVEFLRPVCNFMEISSADLDAKYLHKQSIQKWKTDPHYGFQPYSEITNLAREFGYTEDELNNDSKPLWHYRKYLERYIHRLFLRPAKSALLHTLLRR